MSNSLDEETRATATVLDILWQDVQSIVFQIFLVVTTLDEGLNVEGRATQYNVVANVLHSRLLKWARRRREGGRGGRSRTAGAYYEAGGDDWSA